MEHELHKKEAGNSTEFFLCYDLCFFCLFVFFLADFFYFVLPLILFFLSTYFGNHIVFICPFSSYPLIFDVCIWFKIQTINFSNPFSSNTRILLASFHATLSSMLFCSGSYFPPPFTFPKPVVTFVIQQWCWLGFAHKSTGFFAPRCSLLPLLPLGFSFFSSWSTSLVLVWFCSKSPCLIPCVASNTSNRLLPHVCPFLYYSALCLFTWAPLQSTTDGAA